MFDAGLSWFVVLPDSDPADARAEAVRQRVPGLDRVTHASGRTWLLGRWAPAETVVARFGDRSLAVLGEHRLTTRDLSGLGSTARDAAALCDSVRGEPGSFHVLAATADGIAAHGTLSGYRRLFFGQAGSVPVAGDRADVVAELTGADVDEERLAVRMLLPVAPWPLFWQPVWRGVEAVRPDERLLLTVGGAPRTARRWQPPPMDRSLAGAGALLRDALTAAVHTRTAAGGVVASDLSGLDSTALCCLAARSEAAVVALTCVTDDPLDNDLPWAVRTAEALGTVVHDVIPPEEFPSPYGGLDAAADRFDEPTTAVIYRGTFLALSRRALGHGARLRFSGFGGDELLIADPALQLTMLRTHPRTAIRHLRHLRRALRWTRREVLAAATDRRAYRAWMSSLAAGLGTSAPTVHRPVLGWGPPAHVAPWVSGDAVAVLRRILREQGEHVSGLAGDGGEHGRLAALYLGAAMNRHLAQMTRGAGLPLAVPFFDDHVVEACLAARLPDVTGPRHYKPLLGEAMRGIVPAASLARRDKAETTIVANRSAVDHREQLLTLADDSRLAQRGLIDPATVRTILRSPTERTWFDFDQTIACETWLRGVETTAPMRGVR
ncbi:hypothetical protein Q0Z83_064730 [Actinoplanes sichuanensis]|nr:hypothetical protein Q0Z83_064730 [Actinoplanes sichuanensis]